MSRSQLLDRLPKALKEYEKVSRENQNPYLLLRSDHTSEWTKEQEMFEEYPDVIADPGYIPNLDIFIDIAVWKLGSNSSPNIANLARNISSDVKDHTRAAFAANDLETAIDENLTELNGVGPAVATGLLTFFDPSQYSPMDKFALKALDYYGIDLPTEKASAQYYAEYCEQCRHLKEDTDFLSLRNVDRALWAIGQEFYNQ